MEIRELCSLFNGKARLAAVKKLLAGKGNAVIDGLAGSSAAMLLAGLPERSCPYLIVVNDLDEAGYMYNDLCQLTDDKQVLIFPSGYKRDIKYGQVDAPNEILRTEVLNRWYDDKQVRWVVTYPDALADFVTQEAAEYNATEIVTDATINDIPVGYYRSVEESEGVSYNVITYAFEGEGEYVEVAFWLDGDNAEEIAAGIINTLSVA